MFRLLEDVMSENVVSLAEVRRKKGKEIPFLEAMQTSMSFAASIASGLVPEKFEEPSPAEQSAAFRMNDDRIGIGKMWPFDYPNRDQHEEEGFKG